MKKRSLAMLTFIAVLMGIIGISAPMMVHAETAVLANYKAAATLNNPDGNGGVYNAGNVMNPNYGYGTQGSGQSYHWGTSGTLTGVGNIYAFTTNSAASGQNSLITQTFANDKLSAGADSVNGLVLNDTDGIYIYEAEILPLMVGSSWFDYKFIGNNNKEIITLRLNNGSVLRKGSADIPGTGGKFNWTTNNSGGSLDFNAANSGKLAVGYMKFAFDFKNHTLSAWLVERKTGSGDRKSVV